VADIWRSVLADLLRAQPAGLTLAAAYSGYWDQHKIVKIPTPCIKTIEKLQAGLRLLDFS
jgi:predicted transcriptional regulator